ncbi:MAG: helix-turn-helix domain-containing protein [Nanoarchaeota archaeon]
MNENCTIYRTADFIGKKWTIPIILELYKKKKRYSELKKSLVNITPKILSTRLKELEKEKIINNSKSQIRSEYFLTKSGKEFVPIIKDMKKWALKNKFKNKLCSETNCKHCEF